MAETNWSPAHLERAQRLWAEYQQDHDVSDRLGQTAAIDPVSGNIWFGESAKDIWRQQDAEGVRPPCYLVRVGKGYYLRKGGRR